MLRNYWNDKLLEILQNEALAADLMDVQTIPANSGNTIEFHRINSFAKQLAGISQALGWMTFGDLKGTSWATDSIVCATRLIGNDLEITEEAIMALEPNPMPTLTERFMYNAKDTIDQNNINIMVCNSGTTNSATAPSVSYMGASVSVAVVWGDGSQTLTEATLDADVSSHRIAAESFNTGYTTLRSQSARPRSGSSRRAFDCLVSPEVAGDLRTDGTFQDIALKGYNRGENKFEQAMIGEVFGVRVIESENVSVNFPGTVDTSDQIVRCPIVGQGYAARVSYATAGQPKVNFIPPGKADKSDPYGLIGILTWKARVATQGVLNPLAGVIIKVATTRTKNRTQDDDQTWQ